MERRILGAGTGMAPYIVLLTVALNMAAAVCLGAPPSPADTGTMAGTGLWAQADTDADEGEDEDAFMQDLLNESGAGATPLTESDKTGSDKTGTGLPVRYEGELTGSLWAPNDYDDDWHTTNRLDLKGWGELGAIGVNGRLQLDYQDLEEEAGAGADLRELYATGQIRPPGMAYADIVVGKKILYWGKGDEVRPVDRISPQDLTALYFYDLNDRKTGRVGAFIDMQVNSTVRFEGFWSPYFEASDAPGPGDYFEPTLLAELVDAGITIDDDDEPDEWSLDAGLGGRLMLSLLKADMSIYAFQGYDPNPTYAVNRLAPDPVYGLPVIPVSVGATHPRITFYGADIERSIGSVVLRAEAAYQTDGALFSLDWEDDPTLLLDTPSGVVEKDQLQYVVGMDKNDLFVRNLFLNLQFVGSRIFDHDPQMTASESQTGMTAYGRYTFMDSKVEMWYRFMVLFEDNDQRHHLEIGYKPVAWAQTSIGAVLFDGDEETTMFGQYADRDYVYAKLKLVF